MYDWPERRAEVDAEWAVIRDRLRAGGVDAPQQLSRDIEEGMALWRRPDLLFAQTCWGPMELGLAEHVQVVGQPSYDGIEGGEGEFYSSAIVMRTPLPSPLWGGSSPSSGIGVGVVEGQSEVRRSGAPPTPALRATLPQGGG